MMKTAKIILVLCLSLYSFPMLLGGCSESTNSEASMTDSEIALAKTMNIYFEHASVGGNINDGLNNLESIDSRFDRSNFIFYNRGNPGAKAKIDGFYTRLTTSSDGNYRNPDDFDAMAMKYCYIDNDYDGFVSIPAMFEYYRDQMLLLESQFPDTTFVWWTMPICTSGDAARDQYNTLIRNYCNANGKILFDIADIECHDPAGNKQTDASGEILFYGYTSDGGHLNEAGALKVAEAFWRMALTIAEL